MTLSRITLLGSICACTFVLAGCNGASSSATAVVDTPAPASATPAAAAVVQTPVVPLPTGLVTSGVPASAVTILTLDSGGAGSVGVLAGSYDHTPTNVAVGGGQVAVSGQTTEGANSFGVTVPTGRRYVGLNANTGGTSKIVALETAAGDLPTANAPLTYNGTAQVTAVDVGNGQSLSSALPVTLTANFGTSDVDVVITDGVSNFDIQNLQITGARFAQGGTTVANATTTVNGVPFTYANETAVVASGVFAGPQAAESGLTAVVNSGNERAYIALTAGQ
jgi:hypothetical protein